MKRTLLALALLAAPALAQDAQPIPTPRGPRTLADVARDRKIGIKGVPGVVSAAESTAPRDPSVEAAYAGAVNAAASLQRQVDAAPPIMRAIFYDCKMRYGISERTADCLRAAGARFEAGVKP